MNITVLANRSKINDAVSRSFRFSYGYYVDRWRSFYNEKVLVRSIYDDIHKEINKLNLIDENYIDANILADTIRQYFCSFDKQSMTKSEKKVVELCERNISSSVNSYLQSVLY